jgi:hypothetical protein
METMETLEKEKVVVIGNPDTSPLGAIGKLFRGFCDPRKESEQDHNSVADEDTVTTTPSVYPAPRSVNVGERSLPDPAEDKVDDSEESSKRRKRGIEILLATATAVIGTLVALHQLGYDYDMVLVKNQLSSGRQVFFGGKENTGAYMSKKINNWIGLSFKNKADEPTIENKTSGESLYETVAGKPEPDLASSSSSDSSPKQPEKEAEEATPPLKPEPIESYSDDAIEQEILREILGEDLLI